MRVAKVLLLILALVVVTGCVKTKFNRGVTELPGDFKDVLKQDLEKFATIDEDITRRLNNSYEKTVDGTNDVIRWTKEEWGNSAENLGWVVVKIGDEFELLREAGNYVSRRWKAFGPRCKGLWRDTYSLMMHEVENTNAIDDDIKRYLTQEFELMSSGKAGFKRWVDHRSDDMKGLKAFFRRMYVAETEKGETAMKRLKDYFTKEIK